MNILNKKAIKEILALIKSQWNSDIKLDYGFLKDNNDKLYIVNKEFANLPLEKLRINKIGMYFGQLLHNELRLSIEGSQIIGPTAKKNILEISKEQARDWLKGIDLETEEKLKGFILIKHKKDFMGTGKIKNKKVLNFVPKGRRIRATD